VSRGWYSLKVWFDRRREQLQKQPLCEYCLKKGRETLATVANHNPPHNDDWERFTTGPLESCCKACHDGEVQRAEREAERRQREAERDGLG